jgi:mRNA interferase MazF
MERGEIWWASLPPPVGSGPGGRRPVIVLQSNRFNRSRINTVVVVIITSNLKLADAPGNVPLPAKNTGLERDSVANVSQLITVDKYALTELIGKVPAKLFTRIEAGVRLVLGLE